MMVKGLDMYLYKIFIMKRITVILLTALFVVSCSTPETREGEVSDYGEIVWRQYPKTDNATEFMLCKDEHGDYWMLRVSGGGDLISTEKLDIKCNE